MSVAATNLQGFRNFKAPGPIAGAFLSDRESQARFIRGPVAGGKTVSCIFDCLMNAARMPVCADGKIYYRVAVVGSTYGQLERNLYPTWQFWLPKDGGEWTEGEWEGGGGRFARHIIEFDVLREGQRRCVRFEAVFGAIGELSVDVFMRGFEPTAWYLYEMDQLPNGIVEAALGRLKRYPSKEMLGRQPDYRSYVIGDLNSPDVDSWFYHLMEEIRPPGYRQYVQPSGLSPLAENLQNLAKGYYQNLYELNRHRTRWVKRFILNQYAPSDAGEPVYEDWSDEVHYAPEPLKFDKSRPLVLGFDQGKRQPACVVLQRAASGQWRVLLEVVPGRNSGRRFAQLVKAALAEHCPNATIERAWSDPAGFAGADDEGDELAWAETVGLELGIPLVPAPSQEIDLRLEAVREELTFMVGPGTPGLYVSPLCPILRKGFASDYAYEKRAPGQSQAVRPIKNIPSNPHDALQYALLGEKGRYGVVAGKARARDATPAGSSATIRSDYLSGW